jgi:uncharacterized phiE125 gp8 family phage protein
MRVSVVTPPEPFITADMAKKHQKLGSGTAEDDLIDAYIAAVCAHIDGPGGWLRRAIGVQTLEARGPFFDDCRWALPFPPVIEVESVKYLDAEGAEQVLAADQYDVRGDAIERAWGVAWPSTRFDAESVRVTYRAGYEEIPGPIVAAALLMFGDLYRNRETVSTVQMSGVPMSTTVENLLTPYRVYR